MKHQVHSINKRMSLLLAVGLSTFSCLGCGSLTKQVARNATPVAVESGMKTALSDESQDAVVEAIDSERVEHATEKFAAGTIDGFVNALAEEERQERLAGSMEPMVSSLVNTAMAEALSDEQLLRIRELAKQATLGFQDAIDEVKTKKERGTIPEDQANVLEAADDLAETGDVTLYSLATLAALLFFLLVAGAIWALRGRRKYELEGTRRDQAVDEITRILVSNGFGPADARDVHKHNESTATDAPEPLREAIRRLALQKQSAAGHSEHKQ
jgi:hypothetical protein